MSVHYDWQLLYTSPVPSLLHLPHLEFVRPKNSFLGWQKRIFMPDKFQMW